MGDQKHAQGFAKARKKEQKKIKKKDSDSSSDESSDDQELLNKEVEKMMQKQLMGGPMMMQNQLMYGGAGNPQQQLMLGGGPQMNGMQGMPFGGLPGQPFHAPGMQMNPNGFGINPSVGSMNSGPDGGSVANGSAAKKQLALMPNNPDLEQNENNAKGEQRGSDGSRMDLLTKHKEGNKQCDPFAGMNVDGIQR